MNVKIKRIEEGYTQKELAEKAGISHVTVSKIERGNIEDIKFSTAKKIANALNSTIEELFFNKK